MLEYHSIAKIVKTAEDLGKRISVIVLEDQAETMGLPREKLYAQMKYNLEVMRRSA